MHHLTESSHKVALPSKYCHNCSCISCGSGRECVRSAWVTIIFSFTRTHEPSLHRLRAAVDMGLRWTDGYIRASTRRTLEYETINLIGASRCASRGEGSFACMWYEGERKSAKRERT